MYAGQSPLFSCVYVIATPLASVSSKISFMLFGLGVVSMDSNFTGVSPECLPAQTVQVKFVRILALASCIVTKFDFVGSLHAFGVILCLRHKSKLLERDRV
jgi:hypothetical protein